MDYEGLKFRPTTGSIDLDAIAEWLDAKDYTFRYSVVATTWHLSATRKDMEKSRREHLASPNAVMPSGVLVYVFPEFVGMVRHHAHRAETRAVAFLRWLVSKGDWEVQIDQDPWEPIGDPARLFPGVIESTDDIDEWDHTTDDLTEGTRYTWWAGERCFIVHTSGQWRTELRDSTVRWRFLEYWHGMISPAAMSAWNAAVAATGELIMYVHADVATGSFALEDDEGIEKAWFDASDIPAALKPLAALVEKWVGEIARWPDTNPGADIQRAWRA